MVFKRLFALFTFILLLSSSVVLAPLTVTITPENPGVTDDVTCLVNGQFVSQAYFLVAWYQSGNLMATNVNPLTQADRAELGVTLNPNEAITCVIYDLAGGSAPLGSATVVTKPSVVIPPPGVLTVEITHPADGSMVIEDTEVLFTAQANDPENEQVTFSWNFGDATQEEAGTSTGNANTARHMYAAPGAMTATVTVTDPAGHTATDTVQINVLEKAFTVTLRTFDDADFAHETDQFFRLNPVNMQVTVRDLAGNPLTGADIQAEIVNPNTGSAVPLTRFTGAIAGRTLVNGEETGTGNYFMSLNEIPANDAVLGENTIIVVSFRNTQGGQATKQITILNNLPTLQALPIVAFTVGSQGTLDLNAFATDRETPDAELTFGVSGGVNVQAAVPASHLATFTSAVEGCEVLTVDVNDNDGGSATETVRVCAVAGTGAPVAILTASTTSAVTGVPVIFDASQSFDADGQIVSYQFDFGEGALVNGANAMVEYSYMEPGVYTAKVTVTDNSGLTGSATVVVSVQANRPNAGVVNEAKTQFHEGAAHDVRLGSVRSMTGKVSYRPGERVTLLAVIRNQGSTDEQLQFRVTIPGMQTVSVSQFNVASGDVRLAPIDVVLPATVKSGKYLARVDMTSKAGVDVTKYVPLVVG